MIGVLGNYFLGKRMFETILTWRKQQGSQHEGRYIRLVDYIQYSDVIYNGS